MNNQEPAEDEQSWTFATEFSGRDGDFVHEAKLKVVLLKNILKMSKTLNFLFNPGHGIESIILNSVIDLRTT